MKRATFVVIPLVLLVAAVTGLRYVAQRSRAARDILGSGVIEAEEVNLSPKIGGRVAEVFVNEGDEVEAGQRIATLEHADIDAEVGRAEGAVQAAEAMLRDLERGSRPEQVAAARAGLAEAEAARAGAERQARTAREAYEKVTELKQQVDAARGRVRVARATVGQARAQLDEAEKGATDEDIETLRAALREADTRVESARIAARDADEVYDHQSALATPLIAASTEEVALRATTSLAQTELTRTRTLADGEAATPQSLDKAQAEHDVSEARLTGATQAVGDAREQVAMTQAQARQLRDAARSRLEEATRARDTVKAKLDAVLAGTREERVRLAEAALAAAEAEAGAAQDGLDNASTQHEDRLEPRQRRDAAQAALDQAEARVRAARANLDLLLSGSTKEAIEAARGRVTEAQAALDAARVRRGYCDIGAPCSGTVTDVILDPGEVVQAGGAIAVLADLQNIWLRAYLSFSNLGAIVRGQRLQVATEAVPGKVFDGTVVRISDEAEFTPKDVQTPEQRVTQVYWIKIALGDGEGLLKPGMPADVLPPRGHTTAASGKQVPNSD
jgi:HlyD family secretion protein